MPIIFGEDTDIFDETRPQTSALDVILRPIGAGFAFRQGIVRYLFYLGRITDGSVQVYLCDTC